MEIACAQKIADELIAEIELGKTARYIHRLRIMLAQFESEDNEQTLKDKIKEV